MPHVLVVSAGKLGYPVLLLILMKTDDRLFHGAHLKKFWLIDWQPARSLDVGIVCASA